MTDQKTEQKMPITAIVKMVELIFRAMPYPHQVKTLAHEGDAIRFEWRGVTYRVSHMFGVDEVQGGMLVGSDRAILVRELLNRAREQEAA